MSGPDCFFNVIVDGKPLSGRCVVICDCSYQQYPSIMEEIRRQLPQYGGADIQLMTSCAAAGSSGLEKAAFVHDMGLLNRCISRKYAVFVAVTTTHKNGKAQPPQAPIVSKSIATSKSAPKFAEYFDHFCTMKLLNQQNRLVELQCLSSNNFPQEENIKIYYTPLVMDSFWQQNREVFKRVLDGSILVCPMFVAAEDVARFNETPCPLLNLVKDRSSCLLPPFTRRYINEPRLIGA